MLASRFLSSTIRTCTASLLLLRRLGTSGSLAREPRGKQGRGFEARLRWHEDAIDNAAVADPCHSRSHLACEPRNECVGASVYPDPPRISRALRAAGDRTRSG